MDEVLKIALAAPLPAPLPPAGAEAAEEPAVSDDTITH
jgi:hypothetical protein